MKKYGIWCCGIFVLCLGILTAAYQFSFRYSEEKVKEQAEIQEETLEQTKKEAGYEVSAKGNTDNGEEVFYLTDLNGFVVVYKQDKSTVYEYTNIVTEDLPEDVRKEIEQGKEIRTIEKLYGFLEGYSS